MVYSDFFISLDVVQFVRNERQNRQILQMNNKKYWLTLPVSKTKELIMYKTVLDQNILNHHLTSLRQAFTHYPYFKYYIDELVSFYHTSLNYLNDICEILTLFVIQKL
jgi:hypothetical protein